MSAIKLATPSSGSITISPANTASNFTVTIPAADSTMLTTASTLGVANGGTGLTAVGTSGNVLTSNGTAWVSQALPAGGVTSLNGQTGAITDTDYGAIGSYVIAVENTYTASLERLPNNTVAGSTLFRSNNTSSSQPMGINCLNFSGSYLESSAATSLGLSGTWRRMTRSRNGDSGTQSAANLYVRIS